MGTLANVSTAAHMLAEAKSLEEVKHIVDIAEAARTYAKAAKLGLEAQNHAAELKLRAERKAGELLATLERDQGARNDTFSQPAKKLSEYKSTLDDTGTTYQQAHRWQTVAAVPEAVFEQHLAEVRAEAAEITSAGVLRVARELERAAMHMAKRAAPFPAGKYGVLYADPPWSYSNSGFDQSAAEHYPTMSVADLCELPVRALADDPCVLYMWATVPLLPDALTVLAAWGFEYKTHRVWVKDKAPGIGWWLQTCHELLLIATRNGNAHPSERLPSVLAAPVGRHSRKPDVFREDIERCHAGRRLELFAREAFEGWESWGNESV